MGGRAVVAQPKTAALDLMARLGANVAREARE